MASACRCLGELGVAENGALGPLDRAQADVKNALVVNGGAKIATPDSVIRPLAGAEPELCDGRT